MYIDAWNAEMATSPKKTGSYITTLTIGLYFIPKGMSLAFCTNTYINKNKSLYKIKAYVKKAASLYQNNKK